ncbi:MAG: hypothetical protein ACOYMP_12745 [Nodosilinea sp.]
MNLTLLAGPISFRNNPDTLETLTALRHKIAKEAPEALLSFDFSKLEPKTLVESTRIGDAKIEFHTDVVPFLTTPSSGGNTALLVHSIRITQNENPISLREFGLGAGKDRERP